MTEDKKIHLVRKSAGGKKHFFKKSIFIAGSSLIFSLGFHTHVHQTASASAVFADASLADSNLPSFTGSLSNISPGGGGADDSLATDAAGLASYNQTWTADYGQDESSKHHVSCNTAITTKDGNVTAENFQSVLTQINL